MLIIALSIILSFYVVPAQAASCDREFLLDMSSATSKTGVINVQIVFIEFANSLKKPSNYSKQYIKTINFKEIDKYIKQTSYGKAKFKFKIDYSIIKLPGNSNDYGIAQRMNGDQEDRYLNTIVNTFESQLDFSNVDILWVVPDRQLIDWHMVFAKAGIFNGKKIPVVMLNVPSTFIIVHELLHGIGLRDLYSGGGITGVSGGMREFSIMSGFAGTSILGYEKYKLGWLANKDMICHQAGQNTVTLSALHNKGKKLILIPIDENEMLGVEYRKNEKRDMYLGSSGTLVYHIDNRKLWEPSPINPIYFGNKKTISYQGVNIKINKNKVSVSK